MLFNDSSLKSNSARTESAAQFASAAQPASSSVAAAGLAEAAAVLAEARRSLSSLAGSLLVVKYGGAAMGDAEVAASWARDVALLVEVGARLVVVHGGGPALTRTMARLGLESVFVDGHRVTTSDGAEVAEMVLSGRINKEVVSLLVRAGVQAIGLSGTDAGILRVRPFRPGGRDVGFVGEVEAVETAPLRLLLEGGYTPVISSTAAGREGRPYNINADLVAGAVAAALGASKLVFLSDVPGLESKTGLVRRLDADQARALISAGFATGGMLPKLEGALAALAGGVAEVRMIDGRRRHALLEEFTADEGTGTVLTSGAAGDVVSSKRPPSDRAGMTPAEEDLAGLAAGIGGPMAARVAPPQGRDEPQPVSLEPSLAQPTIGSSAAASAGTGFSSAFTPPAWAGTLASRGAASVMGTYARYPIEVMTGAGCRVTDSSGRSYLDFVAGIAVNVLGHGHPAVAAALRDASRGLLHTSNLYWTEPMVRLAERLTAVSGMERAFFCNSGTEAIETAIKVVRRARPGRGTILVFDRSFHGRTLGALSATIQASYQEPFRPLLSGFAVAPYGEFEEAERAIGADTAAVLVEPIQGEGGVRPAPDGWLAALRAACDRAGALLVLDEVQTGLGRTGAAFAFQHDGIVPDAVACAKALAGGLPMGALLARGEAASALVAGDHGCTFGGGPFIATVANRVLGTVVDPEFLAEVRAKGERLGAALRAIASEHGALVAYARGRGLMWGLALRGPHAPDLVRECHDADLLTVPAGKDVLRLLPPLIISREEIDEAATILRGAVGRVAVRIAAEAETKV